jgi:Fibronectin type III domain
VHWAPVINGLPGTWTTATMAIARKRLTVTGLTPGTAYAFQVRAFGKAGWTDWSASQHEWRSSGKRRAISKYKKLFSVFWPKIRSLSGKALEGGYRPARPTLIFEVVPSMPAGIG